MRKYLSNTMKSFGFIRMIFILVAFLSFVYFGMTLGIDKVDVKPFLFVSNETFNSLVIYIPLCFFVITAFIGLFRIKNDYIDVFDFYRFIGFFMLIGVYLLDFFINGYNLNILISCAGLGVVLLGEMIARMLVKPNQYFSRGKAFYSMLYKPSVMFMAIIAGLAAVSLAVFFKNNPLDTTYLGYTVAGLSLYAVVYFLISLVFKKRNVFDLLTILLFSFSVAFYLANVDTLSFTNEILIGYGILVLYFGIASKIVLTKTNNNVHTPNFYSSLGNKYDLVIANFIIFIAAALLAVTTRLEISQLNSFVKYYEGISVYILGFALEALLVLLLLFINIKLNGKDTTHTDYILYILQGITIISVLFSVKNLYDINFAFDSLNNSQYVIYGVTCLLLLLVLIFSIVRFVKFNNANNEKTVYDPLADFVTDEVDNKEQLEDKDENDTMTDSELTEDDEFEAALNSIPEKEEPSQELTEDDEFEAALNSIPEKEEPAQELTEDDEIEAALNSIPEKAETTIEASDDEDDTEDDSDEESDEPEDDEENKINNAANVEIKEISTVDSEGNKKVIRRKFISKMMFAPYEAKVYYSEIKNYLMMYRAKGRASTACETFRYKGLVAKVAILGKSVKVYLALNPEDFVNTKYRFKDASTKTRYKDVPFLFKVRSDRALKQFKELVDIMMEKRGVTAKRKFEPIDYASSLIPNGEAILTSIGYSSDYILPSVNVRSVPVDLPDDLENYIPIVQGEPLDGDEIQVNMSLDTLCNYFEDGDEISLDILKSMQLTANGNTLRIKARGTLDKKLIIYADEFDSLALKMMMSANCTAVKIVR